MAVVKGSLEGMVKRLIFRSLHALIIHKVTVGKGGERLGAQQLFQEEKFWSRLSLERA